MDSSGKINARHTIRDSTRVKYEQLEENKRKAHVSKLRSSQTWIARGKQTQVTRFETPQESKMNSSRKINERHTFRDYAGVKHE